MKKRERINSHTAVAKDTQVDSFRAELNAVSLEAHPLKVCRDIQRDALILCGDIGGTNSRFELFKVDGQDINKHGSEGHNTQTGSVPGTLLHSHTFPNIEWEDFYQIVGAFLKQCEEKTGVEVQVEGAALAVAGPVANNICNFTNKGWLIDGSEIEKQFGITRCLLINDFVGQGYGLLTLAEHETAVLQEGVRAPHTRPPPIVCVGAGTGLGECYLTSNSFNGQYEVWPSEGGHSDFVPRDELQFEMERFIGSETGNQYRISTERIVSGMGIYNIYRFLCTRFPDKVNQSVAAEIKAAKGSHGGIISMASGTTHDANDQKCDICKLAMEIMVTTFGAECGSAALKFLPTGGVYLSGGISHKILSKLQDKSQPDGFMNAFLDKGRLRPVVEKMAVKVCLVEDVGQRGAKLLANRILGELRTIELLHCQAEEQKLGLSPGGTGGVPQVAPKAGPGLGINIALGLSGLALAAIGLAFGTGKLKVVS